MNIIWKWKKILVIFLMLYVIVLCLGVIYFQFDNNYSSYVITSSSIVMLLYTFPLFFIILGNKDASLTVRYESLSRIDFINDKKYYRNIIKKYSASELLYIDQFVDNEERKAVVLILLKLQLLGKIKIAERGIEIIDNNLDGLKKSEVYILNHINNYKVNLNIEGHTYFYTKKDALEDNLIQDAPNSKKIYLYKIVLIISNFFILIASMWCGLSSNIFIQKISLAIFVFCIFIFPIYYYTFTRMYLNKKSDAYIRTELGKNINQKLNGLKNYIKDFGNLDDVDKEALVLWEDYLIYSVMFGINKNVYKNLVNLINIELEHGETD